MEEAEELEYQVYREFQILERVGKGTYGIVYKAQHKKSKKIFAIKKIIDAFQNLIDAKRTYRELNYLLQLQHPTIVRLEYLLSMSRRHGQQKPSTTRLEIPSPEFRGSNTDKLAQSPFLQQRHVYAVFQYAETDLRVVLKRCPQLQAIQRIFIGYQLLQGIAYLHRSGLVHRDIKPENLLLNCNKLDLRICDFGMARLQSSISPHEGVLTEYVASRWYRPPQALLGISTCQPAIDLWSIGCVLAELALGAPLFPGKSTLDQLELIFRSIGLPSAPQTQNLRSQEARYVINNFSFSRKSKNRPLKDTLSNCSNAEIDLIIRLLTFDPNQRISAEEALKHEHFDEVRGINSELQAFSMSKAVIHDHSDKAVVNEKGQKVNLSIEEYRGLIEQLQKFIQKSSDRSYPPMKTTVPNFPSMEKVEIKDKDIDLLKQKSTKESNFVSQNKHHFLKKTQQALRNAQEKKKGRNVQEKKKGEQIEKEARLDSTSKHVLNVLRKGKSSTHAEGKGKSKNAKRSGQKIDKSYVKEAKPIERKPEIEKIERQSSKPKKMVKGSSQESLQKKKKSVQYQFNSSSKLKDNVSQISNISKASSQHSRSSKSKSKLSKSNALNATQLTSKEDALKKMAKPSQSKSGLVKCKSAKLVGPFGK